ncbi:MAG: hypothetical protein V5A59_07365 [Bacteroidales bacterium]|nr:PPC domain-containing protein [Bacteroidales bacterium]MBS3775993.1 PPC domain-containing protein [Bacteroidales bacterium]
MKQLEFIQKLVIIYGLPVLLIIFSLHSCDLVDEAEDEVKPFQADDYESNDTRDESATIDLSTDIEATIFPEDDVDFYEFQTENTGEWDKVEFDVSNVSEDLEIQIIVYDENGEKVFDDHSDTPGASLTSTFETKGGTYYVEVKSRWGGEIGKYTLNVSNLDYNDEYAPNDSRDEAHDLGTLPAEEVKGVIVSGDEQDWFKFTTENERIWDYVQFDVTDVAEDMEINLAVYNSEGEEVFSKHTSTPGANLTEVKLPTSGGTYYVEVKDRWEEDSESGDYTLDIANLDANDEYEFNDTRDDVYDLGTTSILDIQGAIIYTDEDNGDLDWYMFESTSNEPFTLSFTDLDEDLEVYFEIEDESGNDYSTSNSPGADLNVSSDDMRDIEAKDGGIYYLKVRGHWGGGIFGGDRGDYTLSIEQ